MKNSWMLFPILVGMTGCADEPEVKVDSPTPLTRQDQIKLIENSKMPKEAKAVALQQLTEARSPKSRSSKQVDSSK